MDNETLKRASVMLEELKYLISASYEGYEDIIIDFLYEFLRIITDINMQIKERSDTHKYGYY